MYIERQLERVTIKLTPAAIRLPAKSAAGSVRRKMPAAVTAITAPTVSAVFTWTLSRETENPIAAA